MPQIKHPILTLVLRNILGVFLTFSGSGMLFLAFSGGLDDFNQLAGQGSEFIRAAIGTGYLWTFVGLIKFTSGILLLIPKTAKLGVMVAFPYAINIGLWTIFQATEHAPLGIPVMLLSTYLIYAYFDNYKSIVA